MKCHECNKTMKPSKEIYYYTESGLDNVYLDNVVVYKCECGEEFASIPAINELNATIGLDLIKKQAYLTGAEIKFLRKNIGLNSKSFAEFIGINKSTLSRWENKKQEIDKSNDRLVRLLYANIKGIPQEEIQNFLKDTIRTIDNRKKKQKKIHIPIDSFIHGLHTECVAVC